LISKYLKTSQDIKIQDNCIIGTGYTSCTDINFRAYELINLIQPQILKLEKDEGKLITMKVHPQITNLREFVETFAYQF